MRKNVRMMRTIYCDVQQSIVSTDISWCNYVPFSSNLKHFSLSYFNTKLGFFFKGGFFSDESLLWCSSYLQSYCLRTCFFFTLRSKIEGYTRLLIFGKFSTLPAVIWASPFINFKENFQPFVFSARQMKNFPPYPLLLEPTRL